MSLVKVVFDGAPGTGKSKTLEAIRQFFAMSNNLRQMFNLPVFKVGFVKEAAWDLFEAHPDINRGALNTQRLILQMMQEREEAVKDCEIVFIDRGAYSIHVYEKLFGMEDMLPLQSEIERMTADYDMIYLFHPNNVILRNDGVRIEDEETRMGLHKASPRALRGEHGTRRHRDRRHPAPAPHQGPAPGRLGHEQILERRVVLEPHAFCASIDP
jgi:predicted ATPase